MYTSRLTSSHIVVGCRGVGRSGQKIAFKQRFNATFDGWYTWFESFRQHVDDFNDELLVRQVFSALHDAHNSGFHHVLALVIQFRLGFLHFSVIFCLVC